MDSIIFDLDGTLWNSLQTVINAWNQVLKKYEIQVTEEDLAAVTGLQMKEIGKRLFPNLDEETRKKVIEQCGEVECEYLGVKGGVLYDHLEEVLSSLSTKYKLFIVSNCQAGYIEAFYKYHKLERYFIDYENPGRTGLSKAENIQLIVKRNKLKSPIYVGDTLSDQKSAEQAGVPFVYATYGFGTAEKYDYKIDSFAQLKELF